MPDFTAFYAPPAAAASHTVYMVTEAHPCCLVACYRASSLSDARHWLAVHNQLAAEDGWTVTRRDGTGLTCFTGPDSAYALFIDTELIALARAN